MKISFLQSQPLNSCGVEISVIWEICSNAKDDYSLLEYIATLVGIWLPTSRRSIIFFHGTTLPSGPAPPHYRDLTITLTGHTTHDGNFLDEDQSDAETSTWQHTTLTRDRQPCLVRDSTPKSQQASGRRQTPYFARPLGSTLFFLMPVITSGFTISVCWAVTSCGIRVWRYFPPKLWKASTRLCGVTFQSSANIHRPKSPEFLCMSAAIFYFH